MGYSHYWERPAVLGTEEEFEDFAKDCRTIFAYCVWTTYEEVVVPWPTPAASILDAKDPVAGNWGLGGTLVTKRIAPCENLATVARGSYEPVYIGRCSAKGALQLDIEKDLFFRSCKTAYRPYDLTVTAVLIALKHHFPVSKICSDGEEKDWLDGRILCNNILGYGLNTEIGN
jgi:hypothetical protein